MKILQISMAALFFIATIGSNLSAQSKEPTSFRPAKGYVPDKETALTIAIGVLTPIYGKETIDSERPFQVREEKGIWIVTGATPSAPGGAAEIRISRKSGEILFLMHYK